jgi:hypothetical protein
LYRSLLPFLGNALLRHLQQFPSVTNGLSRTQKQILEATASGDRTTAEIFWQQSEREESPFMGDSVIWQYLHEFCTSREPLLEVTNRSSFAFPEQCQNREEFLAQQLRLTDRGRNILQDREDWIAINGIDRWLGGVHLTCTREAWADSNRSLWRWNEQNQKLILT